MTRVRRKESKFHYLKPITTEMNNGNPVFHGFLWLFLILQTFGISVEALFTLTIFYESIVHGLTLFILLDESKFTLMPIYVIILVLQHIPFMLVRRIFTFLVPLGVTLLYFFAKPKAHSKEIMTHIFVVPAGISLFTFFFFFPMELYGKIPRKSLAKLIIRPFIVCLIIEVASFYFLHAPLLDGEYRYKVGLGQRRWMALMATFTLQYLILIAKCFIETDDDLQDDTQRPLLLPIDDDDDLNSQSVSADSSSSRSRMFEAHAGSPAVLIHETQQQSKNFDVSVHSSGSERTDSNSALFNIQSYENSSDYRDDIGELV